MTSAPAPAAVVLAGGLGTRLPEVSAILPKPMADIEGRPFVEHLLAHLAKGGITDVVLSVGYKAEAIERHFANGRHLGLKVRCVREPQPLGTAGALRLALPWVGEEVLVLNGDTFVDVDIPALRARHRALGAAVTLTAVERDDASRFGRIQVSGDRVLAFKEKVPKPGPGLISAGVYLFKRQILEAIPSARAVSIEQELLPQLLATDTVVGVFQHRGYFVDIGVPEDLAAFRARVRSLGGVAMRSGTAEVRREVEESIAVKNRWSDELCSKVATVAERIAAALKGGGKVVFFGNGGSAADAQHLAAEFVGRYQRERPPWRALAFHTNTSALTAIANDYEYAMVFERQVDAWVEKGDVAVGISTSGNSESVVRGLARARARGAFTVALTGEGGGRCAGVCDLLLAIPSKSTPRIQESHITLGHILCARVETALVEGA